MFCSKQIQILLLFAGLVKHGPHLTPQRLIQHPVILYQTSVLLVRMLQFNITNVQRLLGCLAHIQPQMLRLIFLMTLWYTRPASGTVLQVITIEAPLRSAQGRHSISTDHNFPGQVSQHAGAATWQPNEVSLASCAPVQRKEKCSTSTCSPGYAMRVVTVHSYAYYVAVRNV